MGERFGGQILDTVDIENYISVPKTEGQKLAGALKVHVDEYDVDVIDSQSASKLIPAAVEGGLHQIETASGAVLKARSIIVATGAKWRNMNVPGEDQYRTKGVTYCPHCDGPLFKGKRVAVLGGGFLRPKGAKFLQDRVYDSTLVQLEYPGNVHAHIYVSWLHPYKQQLLVVAGSKGMLSFDDASDGKEIRFYNKRIDFENGVPVKVEAPDEIIPYEKKMPLEEELRYFVEHLDSTIGINSGEAGYEVVKVLETVQQIIENNGQQE